MLYSLAILCYYKRWRLEFYVDHIPTSLIAQPIGNYAAAISLGARVLEDPKQQPSDKLTDLIWELAASDPEAILIPEGGACSASEAGIKALSQEISHWAEERQLEDLKVMLPSGTGTSAYYLQKHLPCDVLTCACVGGPDYLRKQMHQLEQADDRLPTILTKLPEEYSAIKKFHFGKTYQDFYDVWAELKSETGVEFDLLYDPLGWLYLLGFLNGKTLTATNETPTIVYLHQGGLKGNESMFARYQRMLE